MASSGKSGFLKPTDNTAPLFLPSNINNQKEEGGGLRMPRVDKSLLELNGHWEFPEQMYTDNYIGFVYAMQNKLTGMKYIGKKLYAGMGVQNKGVESNWKYYCSSNKLIDADVKVVRTAGFPASELFDFICLEQYRTKGGLSFAEVWSLVMAETPSNYNKFYNRLINGVSWAVRERVTDRHKTRFFEFLER